MEKKMENEMETGVSIGVYRVSGLGIRVVFYLGILWYPIYWGYVGIMEKKIEATI